MRRYLRIQIQVEPQVKERIDKLVKEDSTRHPSASQVVREALKLGLPALEKGNG